MNNTTGADLEDLKQLKGDVNQLKMDNVEIKINLGTIKNAVDDMSRTVTNNVEKLTEALISLATHTEKTNYIVEENKKINKRIDHFEDLLTETNETIGDLREDFEKLKVNHDSCIERRRQSHIEASNSPLTIAVNRIKEMGVYAVGLIFLYFILKNLPDLLQFIGTVFGNGATVTP